MSTQLAGTRKKRSYIRAALGAFLIAILVGASPLSASAKTESITGWGHFGDPVYYGFPREPTRNTHKATFKFTSISHDGASYAPRLALGMTNGSGQFARGETGLGGIVSFKTNSGSFNLPKGRFYMSSRLIGSGCASSCREWTWNASFSWDLA